MDSDDDFMSGLSSGDEVNGMEQDSDDGSLEDEFAEEEPDVDFSQKDLKPSRKAYEVDFRVYSPAEIQAHQDRQIEEVSAVLGQPLEATAILLRHLRWNKERLIDMYMEKPDAVLEEAGLGSDNSSTPIPKVISGFTCEICCDEVPGMRTYALKCGHRYCVDCYQRYLAQKIKDEGEAARIQCPTAGCHRIVDSKSLDLLVAADLKSRYRVLLTRTYVDDKENLKWCPAPNCVYAIDCDVKKKDLGKTVPTVACACKHRFCFGCTLNDHQPAPCSLVKMWIKKCEDDSETANWISANTKECPKCSSTIEKNGGCNHMTCRKCKHEFCWMCMGLWSEHGTSWYNCNRFEEKSGEEGRDAQARSRQSLERYLHYYNRYANHEQSAKLDKDLYLKTEKKMTSLQTTSGMSWIDVQFLETASQALQQCRQTLKWTYAFAYYLQRNNFTEIFEDNQRDLEMAVESLSEMFEKPTTELPALKLDMMDKTTYCNKRRVILLGDTAQNLKDALNLLSELRADTFRRQDLESVTDTSVLTETANGLLRIFWPSDAPKDEEEGTLIGWRNSAMDVFVVGVLQNVEVSGPHSRWTWNIKQAYMQTRRIESALRIGTLYRGSPHPIRDMFELCGTNTIHVLGQVNPVNPSTSFDPDNLLLYTKPSRLMPSVFCPQTTGITAQVILFDRPSPYRMQYMSLKPISLVLEDNPLMMSTGSYGMDATEANNENERQAKSRLVDKLKFHTVFRHPPTQKEKLLPTILAQINCSSELAKLISRNTFVLGTRQKRSLSVSEKVVESATTVRDYVLEVAWHVATVWIYPVATRIFIIALIWHRLIAETVLRILEWRPRPDSAALKDISATAQQVDIRLQQFCYWPIQYMTLRKRKADWDSITNRHPDYIRFYNSLWLVANDVIIGIALGSYIIENAAWVAWQINTVLNGWTIEGLMNMISWLMDWPAGLKLNNELAVFLGGLFLFMIDYWRSWVVSLQPLLPAIIYFIGFASFAGATMPIALFSDLLSILTIHIYCFYTASARIFNWQLTIIMSLFHLFRGKKHNILRNRIDSCDYDLDQLLLGTILFTLLFFLLPTIAVFYLTFTSARMAIIFLKAAQDTLLACLNHFPLFALMLRIKDPRRLPGGICFELKDSPPMSVQQFNGASQNSPTSYIMLKSVPLSLRAMFDQYFQLAHRIRKHYLSPRVVLCLVTGRFLPPIHRKSMYSLQYSMLPAQRAGVLEMWAKLTEENDGRAEVGRNSGAARRNGRGHATGQKGMNGHGALSWRNKRHK
ncbi:MAG: hypothetical protein Q9163_002335 [Psora crenata]